MRPLSERLTARFYEWEQRGRGWQLFDVPVDPEPPFHPFFGHYAPAPKVIDDGYHPSIFQKIGGLFFSKKQSEADEQESDIPTVEPYIFESEEPLTALKVILPKEQKVEIAEMEQLLLMLTNTTYPVSFEIEATERKISVRFICRNIDVGYVDGEIRAFFPGATVATESLDNLKIFEVTSQSCFVDFGLADEFMRPLAMANNLDPDPFIGLFGSFEHLQGHERIIVQVLFKGAVNPWAESIIRSVTDNSGGSFFANAPDMVRLAQEKVAYPLYGVTIRVIGQASSNERAESITTTAANSLIRITKSNSNLLITLNNNGYALENFCSDIENRETHRLGMLLNLRELATLVHIPSHTISTQRLERIARKTKAAPALTEKEGIYLGVNIHKATEKPVYLPASVRTRHMHVIGATGSGKSTFLQNVILEDIQDNQGLCLIDPHGDLIDGILGRMPEERIQDCIVLDPSDADYPVGFNILSAHSDIERDILSSDLVAVFRKQSMAWGDQMNSVLANAILAYLESTEGGTLADLRRFLLETAYRNKFLKTVKDPSIVYYWQQTFPLLKYTSIGPIMSRLDTFLRPKLIRYMIAQKTGLDFEAIMDNKKILLVKLSQGLIGTENSYLLGSFIVSKMYQAAMARQAKSQSERNDFFLFIDEFQNYITPSLSAILAGGRKYGLGLVLAHQEMQQIQKYDSELASAVITNPATRVCFRLGDIDAKRFEEGFSFFVARDLQDLKTGEAIVRIDRPENDFNLSVSQLPEVNAEQSLQRKQEVIQASRNKYGTPKQQVEALLNDFANMLAPTLQEKPEPKQESKPIVPKSAPQPVLIQPTPAPQLRTETQHRATQMFIKRMAEARGYIARIEQQTPDGKGRVDVLLEREGKKIACEVSVTTADTWEAHNIEKCVAAGYDLIAVCSDEAKTLNKIRKQIQVKFTQEQQKNILTFTKEELITYLDGQIAKEATKETVMKGYRVKVEYGKK